MHRVPAGWLVAASLAAHSVSSASAEEVLRPASELAARSPNVSPAYAAFGDLTLCVGRGGFMEWTVPVRGGTYHLHLLYASAERRPCRLRVGSLRWPSEVLAAPTGGFFPADLRWATVGPFELAAGAARVRLEAEGFMPHLRALALSTSRSPPERAALPLVEGELRAARARADPAPLRRAIERLARRYGESYPRAGEHLARLAAIEAELAAHRKADPPEARLAASRLAASRLAALRLEALVRDHPRLRSGRLLFVRRRTFQSSHYYTDYIDGCRYFGGNLCALSLSSGEVRELVPSLAGGIFGRCDLSFDGRRVVFGYKARLGEGFRIWEVGVDGAGLRQLTRPPPDEAERIETYWQRDSAFLRQHHADYRHHTDDMHPAYLPDGGICFISTRCERGILCDPPDLFTTTTLYRMDGDGGRMEVLSQSPVSEASPSVMNDGRILYTRWEYVDKADVVIKCLWAMRPDGTGSVEVFGNDITFPDTLLHGRAVPGSDRFLVVIGAPHMPLGVGTVIRLDLTRSIRTREPMTYITPEVDVRSEHGFSHRRGGRWVRDQRGPLWTDAWPLDESSFLASGNPDRDVHDPSAYGIWYLDDLGNRLLVHQEAETSCWQPMPLEGRARPPVIPREYARGGERAGPGADDRPPRPATVFLSDVYDGLEGVARGTVRYLRIVETVPRPWAARRFWAGDTSWQQHAVVSMNTHLHVKRLWGIIPVEPDGSALFRVPADRNLFFQALDGEFMEVQRMRTFVDFRPGEWRSCNGCHAGESRAPRPRPALALRRPPSDPAPQPGDARARRPIHYPSDVQPILDRHCVRCHGPRRKDAGLDLSGELTTLFNRSYEEILRRDLVRVVRENQPKTGDASPIPPYTLGSHASRLVKLLREGHEGVELERAEWARLVTWVDANAPYYGSYFGRRNLRYRGLPDFRPLPEGALARRAEPVAAGGEARPRR